MKAVKYMARQEISIYSNPEKGLENNQRETI